MNNYIVVDIGAGDGGKGVTTDYLCSKSVNSLVIRFNGGSQAGHTVYHNVIRHVFSNFGSGSLRGAPTYWSSFCSIYPKAVLNEYDVLETKGIKPKLYVDALCPVTTIYDIYSNQNEEKVKNHGSCGVGFGATMRRHLTTPYKIYAQDLKYPQLIKLKLKSIRDLYGLEEYLAEEDSFIHYCSELLDIIEIVNEIQFLGQRKWNDLIMEGAQGILLDMDHGFFPHVTYSNTTAKNALDLLQRNDLLSFRNSDIFYVTRAYQTRHGNGPMTNEERRVRLKDNPEETNITNRWQGKFRKTILDLDLLKYSLGCDRNYSGNIRRNLVISCLDQIDSEIEYTEDGELKSARNPKIIGEKLLKSGRIFGNYSPFSSTIKEL